MKISKLKKLRVLNDMTQNELAKKIGISQSYLSQLERGQREINYEVKQKIEEIFGLSYKFID